MVRKYSGDQMMSDETPRVGKIIILSALVYEDASSALDQTLLEESIDIVHLLSTILGIGLKNSFLHLHGKHHGLVPYSYIPVSLNDALIPRVIDPTAAYTEKNLHSAVQYSKLQTEINLERLHDSSF